MSGLTPEQVTSVLRGAIGDIPAFTRIAANGTRVPSSSSGSSIAIPDWLPATLRHRIEQQHDRSTAHHSFVNQAVALGLNDDQVVVATSLFAPSVGKYGNRLEAEVRRSIPKARVWLKEHDDVLHGWQRAEAEAGALDPSWQAVDLDPVLAGDVTQPYPSLMRRHDSRSLIYRAQINGLHGPSGEGKGQVTCWSIVQAFNDDQTVMLLDFEDVASSIVARLRMYGATDDQIRTQLVYVRPSAPFNDLAVIEILRVVAERDVDLAVIDSLGEAFGLEGINEDKDSEVGPWLRRVARRIADAGPAVLLIDHTTKAADNPLFPSGSKRKRAAIGGASYLVTAVRPLLKGKGGRLTLTCAKDRHGNYARGETVAAFNMIVTTDGAVVAELYAPDTAEADPLSEIIARAAVKAAKAEGKPMSQNALVMVMKVKASAQLKRGGIDLAVGRGALKESAGPKRARLFEYVCELPKAGQ